MIIGLLLLGDDHGIYGLHSGLMSGLISHLHLVCGHALRGSPVLQVNANTEYGNDRHQAANEAYLELAEDHFSGTTLGGICASKDEMRLAICWCRAHESMKSPTVRLMTI